MAAALSHSLARNDALIDDTKRLALAAAWTFRVWPLIDSLSRRVADRLDPVRWRVATFVKQFAPKEPSSQ
jgi:hypothetical protein